MKHRIKRFLIGTLVSTVLCSYAFAATFPDVMQTEDYAEAVDYLSDIGIMLGDDLGKFNPTKPVTRAEMAAIICRMYEDESDGLQASKKFSDVPDSHWANKYVSKAVELGVVNGYGDGRFGPGDSVTYDQTITMVVRAMGLDDIAKEWGGYPEGYKAVANDYGYSNGVYVDGATPLSRGQIAVIIYNAIGR